MKTLADLFREAREKLFMVTKHRHAHERQWETEEEERRREEDNKRARAEWDQETERLIKEADQQSPLPRREGD